MNHPFGGATDPAPGQLLPLLAQRDLAAPLAWSAGRVVTGHAFLAGAAQLAARLPMQGRAINLCQDRLQFALGLAAALQRGHLSLMPPNALAATLRQLPAEGAPAYVLADAPAQAQAQADQPADLDPGAGPVSGPVPGPASGPVTGPDPEAAAIDDALRAVGLPVIRVGVPPLIASAAPFAAAGSSATAIRPGATAVPGISTQLEAVCLLTSGSTGAPQPHAKRFASLMLNIAAEAARLAEWLQRPSLHGVTVVATVPPQHSYGLESSVLLALLGGACFEAGRPFYPADIAAALQEVPRPRALVTTPFHLKALLLSGVTLPPVDLVLSATAPLSPQLAARAEAAMGGVLGEIYGCTEAGQVAARRTTQGETWTTLGALRITRATSGTAGAAETGEAGERFIVSGGHVTEPTPLADVLVLQDDRRFRLLGRANDLIHVAGKRSSLAHLNFHLNRIEGVDDGAFWLPETGDLPAAGEDIEAVQRPIALVVAPTLSARQIIAALRAELEPAFVPRRVLHVDALPREATGKLTVAALRQFALSMLAKRAAGNDSAADIYPIPADHPAFAGHFPGHPLLPGVALLTLVLRSLARRPALRQRLGEAPAIEQVKFLSPVGPGAQVQVQLRATPAPGTGVAFECLVGGRIAARGQLGRGRPA
jgi:acyl-CoA synthetase (AMP-forming)/AMP-acid ligase II/3-hydroxymyristoyl/3-hydroxydecanoyl-(acyl carrier protein) dehydratase